MNRSRWRAILEASDKGISKAKGALSVMCRKILHEGRIGEVEWERRLRAWLDDPVNGFDDKQKKQGERNNLRTQLEGSEPISFYRFMQFIRVINPKRFTITVKLEFDDRDDIEVSIEHESE